MSMGHAVSSVSTPPSRGELRQERRWLPWRERKAEIYADHRDALKREIELKVELESVQARRQGLERDGRRMMRRAIWMLLGGVILTPFYWVYDKFTQWMSNPDMHRQ